MLHWTEVFSGHFSISFFLTRRWWYWNAFLPKYVHFNELKSFYHLTIFWFKNAKIKYLKKIGVLSADFIKLKYRWVQTCLDDLRKHQILEILLMTDFFMNICFKNLIFHSFQYFLKSSAANTKSIVCVLFHVHMFDQRQYNLISLFLTRFFFKTGVYFRFYHESLKVIKMAHIKYILRFKLLQCRLFIMNNCWKFKCSDTDNKAYRTIQNLYAILSCGGPFNTYCQNLLVLLSDRPETSSHNFGQLRTDFA